MFLKFWGFKSYDASPNKRSTVDSRRGKAASTVRRSTVKHCNISKYREIRAHDVTEN